MSTTRRVIEGLGAGAGRGRHGSWVAVPGWRVTRGTYRPLTPPSAPVTRLGYHPLVEGRPVALTRTRHRYRPLLSAVGSMARPYGTWQTSSPRRDRRAHRNKFGGGLLPALSLRGLAPRSASVNLLRLPGLGEPGVGPSQPGNVWCQRRADFSVWFDRAEIDQYGRSTARPLRTTQTAPHRHFHRSPLFSTGGNGHMSALFRFSQPTYGA